MGDQSCLTPGFGLLEQLEVLSHLHKVDVGFGLGDTRGEHPPGPGRHAGAGAGGEQGTPVACVLQCVHQSDEDESDDRPQLAGGSERKTGGCLLFPTCLWVPFL